MASRLFIYTDTGKKTGGHAFERGQEEEESAGGTER
jgi:hypothetical protein